MVGNGMGAKNGIMFKTAVSLEEAGKTEVVALDKTGTITSGEPRVTDLIPARKQEVGAGDERNRVFAEGKEEEMLLAMAYALEKKSEHPLARAILQAAEERKMTAAEVTEFKALPGNGLSAKLDGETISGGNLGFISSQAEVSEDMKKRAEQLAEEGKTPLFFSRAGELMGMIAVADVIKEDSPQAVRELQNMGIHVVMLTGDNERTARAIGAQAGVDEVIAGVLPDGKESVIRSLKNKGKVAMVGFEQAGAITDLYALSQCDYLLGPPSTFSQWASFYGNGKLCFVKNRHTVLHMDDFKVVERYESPFKEFRQYWKGKIL